MLHQEPNADPIRRTRSFRFQYPGIPNTDLTSCRASWSSYLSGLSRNVLKAFSKQLLGHFLVLQWCRVCECLCTERERQPIGS